MMPRELQRSGSNSLASLLRAEPPDDALAVADSHKLGERDGPRRRSRRSTRRRSCLRLPLGGAGGCRVCDCDDMDSAAALPRRRAPGNAEDGDGEEEDHDGAVQCFSWKKGAAAAAVVPHRPSTGTTGQDMTVVAPPPAASLSVLPDDVTEMVLARLPLASLLAARCACRRWRDLTAAPQFLRLRRGGGTPWLFLFGAGGGGDVGWGAAPSPAVHALDVDARRWRCVEAGGLRGRFHFSVAAVGDELYVVGGRSGGSGSDAAAGGGKVKTHRGVLVFSPLAGSWRKAAPMRAARSRPVLGVFEMSAACSSVFHARAAEESHVRRGGRSRHGGAASAVYEDPHRLSLRRFRLKDMLNDDDAADPTDLAPSSSGNNKPAAGEEEGEPRHAVIAVGGRGQWDEPLVSGEIYDPLADRWVEIAAGFPADVGLACSGAVCGRVFYVYCESDTLVAYHLDAGSWALVQTSRPPPPRLRDYPPALVACCASRLFMLCVSWCDDRRGPAASRREKVVRKLFELDLSSLEWTEAAVHPDAPMDPNAAFAAGGDRIYAVEMFRIFGKVLDFVTACRVSGTGEQRWSRVGRENAATEADAMSCRLKSMAVLHL
ncbi:unnamed protein product [Urochloa decumbens]|uniref:F-box domain-containing protein n=1 Tax=Urochloa decumbens TaxID=240449 RepID=A0ABC9FWA6_9POAL